MVVLADEDYRQLPDARHIERLVEGSLVRRAVAEEADADLVGSADVYREPGAAGDAVSGADDAVRAEYALVAVGYVHRASLALAVARLTAEELGHHQVQVSALGDDVAVAAVGCLVM